MANPNFPEHLRALLGEPADDRAKEPAATRLCRSDVKLLESLTKHYTDLFTYQARQRLDAIRFFFVGYALLATALVSLIESDHFEAAAAVAFFSGLVSLVFLRLDYRNAQIVEINEKPLKGIQAFLGELVGGGAGWETFERCDKSRQTFTTYGTLAPALFSLFWVASFLSTAYLVGEIVSKRGYSDCTAVIFGGGVAVLLLLIGGLTSSNAPVVTDDYSSGPRADT